MNTTALSAPRPGRRRRRHSLQFKAEVVGACGAGVSLAGVALAHGINANLLRRWVIAAEHEHATPSTALSANDTAGGTGGVASFVPVSVEPSPMPTNICIELSRNGLVVRVNWPTSAAAECGAWLREALR